METQSSKNIDPIIDPQIAKKLGFFSLDPFIQQFKDVSLQEMIRANTEILFLEKVTKTCYRMEYGNLKFSAMEARDNFNSSIIQSHLNSYVKQQMHSLSGEQNDLCFYTYSPTELVQFLEQNKKNHYTFLPMTVHATDSANGYRHDMLLIFDNKTRLFYWFDGRNREDFVPLGNKSPKNAIDILFINMADQIKLGYSYEPSPSWMIQGVLQPIASIGQLDFVLSTTWCYLAVQLMDSFESPTGFLSALDTLSKEDRFNLLYNALLNMICIYKYHKTLPQNVQVNFYDEKVPVASNQILPDVQPQIMQPPTLCPIQHGPDDQESTDLLVPSNASNPSSLRQRTNVQGYTKLTESSIPPLNCKKQRGEKDGCVTM